MSSPSAITTSVSAMEALKAGTHDLHKRLERRLAGVKRFSELAAYTDHLSRLSAYQAAAEAAWSPLLSAVLSDFPARRKAHLLARDVMSVGGTISAWPEVPRFDGSYAVLGGFYVLEGASLGGQFLLLQVERHLGLNAEFGASYLASYGSNVRSMWARFGAELDAHCRSAAAIEVAVAAAQATFSSLEHCLSGDLP